MALVALEIQPQAFHLAHQETPLPNRSGDPVAPEHLVVIHRAAPDTEVGEVAQHRTIPPRQVDPLHGPLP